MHDLEIPLSDDLNSLTQAMSVNEMRFNSKDSIKSRSLMSKKGLEIEAERTF